MRQTQNDTELPWLRKPDGQMRLVGVELELAGLGLMELAHLIQQVVGGRIEQQHEYLASVRDTSVGTVRVEFDATIFRELKVRKLIDDLTTDLVDHDDRREVEKTLARLAQQLTPFELVFDPLPVDRLHELEAIRWAVGLRGQGTGSSPLSAYGVHFNVEAPDLEVSTVLAYLRAFLVLQEKLRTRHRVDLTRTLYGFLEPFPKEFALRVLDGRYRPDRREFLEDYLEANATRNRPLDLLPLLCYWDEGVVRSRLPHEKITPRPAFHYRLPNSRVDELDRSLQREWRVWLEVERLAHDPQRLARLAKRERLRLSGPLRFWYRQLSRSLDFSRRPVIAVTGPDRGGVPAWLCTRLAVWRAGGRALRFTPDRYPPGSLLPPFDGLILGGGADVDPGRYGEELQALVANEERILQPNRRERLYTMLLAPFIFFGRTLFSLSASEVDLARDEFEHRCLERALAEGMPVLGICRGAQFLNVHFGGKLYGDLSSYYGDVSKMKSVFPKKRVELSAGCKLEALLKTRSLWVNSLHNQAVSQLGDGIEITARDRSGVVQGIEHPDYPYLIGVQWHPEYLPVFRRQQRLFRGLVLQAREHTRRGR